MARVDSENDDFTKKNMVISLAKIGNPATPKHRILVESSDAEIRNLLDYHPLPLLLAPPNSFAHFRTPSLK
jgi:hypothetical protein